ncbi:hypothetical protein [Chamaesiphon sp.]|uniref:hypothetical protein n=1 Tax=Chamaesiphon sp. TaxID=2814140 RepID=UPI0035944B2B
MNIPEIIDRLNMFKSASIIRFGTNIVEIFYCYSKDNNVWKISSQAASSKPFGEVKALYYMSNLSTDEHIQATAAAIFLDFQY